MEDNEEVSSTMSSEISRLIIYHVQLKKIHEDETALIIEHRLVVIDIKINRSKLKSN